MGKLNMPTVRQRAVSLIAAGALAVSTAALPMAAFADNQPSQVGSGVNGTGATALNMITVDDGTEHTETGPNVKFTFPSAINYVVNADGDLTGPTAEATYIQNGSQFPIHVNSVKVVPQNGWNFQSAVPKVDTAATDDNVFLNIGPAGHEVNIAIFTTKAELPTADKPSWAMAFKGEKVGLASRGKVGKVKQDITKQTQFGKITWYVKAGAVS